jgi:hypothetical protein
MKRLLFGLGFLLTLTASASAANFANWAVLVVAGDNHAHSGAPSAVFDNARHDLVKAFAGIGFAPSNMAQFAVSPDPAAQHSTVGGIANTLWDISTRAPDGCLIYFTSHGTPDGIVIDDNILGPDKLGAIVNNACGSKPSVIVMSSCFSGQFVPALEGENRMVLTAARPDRTSFGCGELDQYTFFDDCFLRALPMAGDFPKLGELTRQCVAFREQQMKAEPPSEPQLSVGPKVGAVFKWRDGR